MPNPTRQEIIDAYEMLDVLLGYAEDRNPDLVPTRRRIIEKALPPRPQHTMAEIEWDDDKHYLAEAEHVDWGTVIMLYHDETMRRIQYICTGGANPVCFTNPDALTPTGKRYTLTETENA